MWQLPIVIKFSNLTLQPKTWQHAHFSEVFGCYRLRLPRLATCPLTMWALGNSLLSYLRNGKSKSQKNFMIPSRSNIYYKSISDIRRKPTSYIKRKTARKSENYRAS